MKCGFFLYWSMWSICAFLVFAVIVVGLTEAPQVTVVLVQIGSLVAVLFAVLRIERTKEKWANKYHRGFYRLWMVFSFLPVIALIRDFSLGGSYRYPPSDPVEAWGIALLPVIVLYHRVCDRAWRVLSCRVDYSGLPMSRVKRLPIWNVKICYNCIGFRGRGQRHCAVVSPTPIDRA